MKRTQLIDACRNVRKELVAFLSIVVIGMLAAVAYLSIAYAAATLEKDANIFFNGSGLWDLQVSSTLLMDDEDLEAIRALPGVGAAEAVLQTGAQLRIGRSMTDVTVMDVPEEIARPVLLSGRLPETAGECAIEKKLADDGEFSVGQTISLTNRPVMGIEPLKETDFVITGVFQTPEHISYMVSVTPYVLVSKESFNREELQGSFMTTLIRVADAPEDRYSDAYWDAVRGKTAYAFLTACRMACRITGRPAAEKQALEEYGLTVGMMFQLRDDLLDWTEEEAKLGKPVNEDFAEGVYTLPAIRTFACGEAGARLRALAEKESLSAEERALSRQIVRDAGGIAYAEARLKEMGEKAAKALTVLPESPYREAMNGLRCLLEG